MSIAPEGKAGQGYKGYSKYDAASAPMDKNGGNSAEHDSIEKDVSPQSMYGGSQGSLSKAKGE